MRTGTLIGGCVVAMLPAVAVAQPGGYRGHADLPITSAADAKELPDDTFVRLRGHVVRSLGDEEYEFRDDSGMVVVEIDDDDWQGVVVGPGDRVELYGEVDRNFRSVEVDVDVVKLVS